MGWIRQAGLLPPGAEGLWGPQRERKDGGEKHRTLTTLGVSVSAREHLEALYASITSAELLAVSKLDAELVV